MARKKAYYTEVLAKTPIEKAEGIAVSSGSLTTSSGKVIPGKITIKDIQVPDDYWVKFDYMEVAIKRFKEYMEVAKRFKEYIRDSKNISRIRKRGNYGL